MASDPGPMDVPYGQVASVPIGGGIPSRPDAQFPPPSDQQTPPTPPEAARVALELLDAKTALIQAMQDLASFGDATQPKPGEDFQAWQIRRDKISHAHEQVATLRAKIPQYEELLRWEESRKRQQLIADAHAAFNAAVETHAHCFRALVRAREEIQEANMKLLSFKVPSRTPNDWLTSFYVPGVGMTPPPGLGLTLDGSTFPPRQT
jgi:hypothetical protein